MPNPDSKPNDAEANRLSRMAINKRFDFDPDFNDKVLFYLCESPDLFRDIVPHLTPRLWTGVQSAMAARTLLAYWKEHDTAPSLELLRTLTINSCRGEGDFAGRAMTLADYFAKIRDRSGTGEGPAVQAQVLAWLRQAKTFLVLHDLVGKIQELKPIGPDDAFALVEAQRLGSPDTGRSLIECAAQELDPNDILLGERFLCKGGGMLFIAGTGQGKSSAGAQQDLLWSLGREAFGIRPARPLKILCIQGENDDGDLKEMANGVIDGLGITKEEDLRRIHENTRYEFLNDKTGIDFLAHAAMLVKKYRPDLLRIDPLNSFIGSEVTNQGEVTKFLRNGLNPILTRHRVGAIINCHTPKTNQKTRSTDAWKPSDWAYAAAGTHELSNWARAIIAFEATYSPEVFRFQAAKRGTRLGWTDEADRFTLTRYFAHSGVKGRIYWQEPTDEQMQAAEEAKQAAKGKGRQEVYANSVLLRPFDAKNPLTLAEWLSALEENRCHISQKALYLRANKFITDGHMEKAGRGLFKRTSEADLEA